MVLLVAYVKFVLLIFQADQCCNRKAKSKLEW